MRGGGIELARDRLGIKPLYFPRIPGGVGPCAMASFAVTYIEHAFT
jgi:hypothetical protein